MSDQTKSALEQALRDHVYDEQDGAMLTGFILQTSAIPADADDTDNTKYLAAGMDGQPFHSGLGLAHMLLDYYTLDMDDD